MDKMPIFEIEEFAPWGDYGAHLVNATAPFREDENTPERISRTGLFVPPLYKTVNSLIVREDARREIESSFPAMVSFVDVIYDYITVSDWHTWDFGAPEPKFYPKGGEPDDYRFRKATPKQVASMPRSFELKCGKIRSVWFTPDYDPKSLSRDITPAQFTEMTKPLFIIGENNLRRALELKIFTGGPSYATFLVTAEIKEWMEDYFGKWFACSPVQYKVVNDDEDLERYRRYGVRGAGVRGACPWSPPVH